MTAIDADLDMQVRCAAKAAGAPSVSAPVSARNATARTAQAMAGSRSVRLSGAGSTMATDRTLLASFALFRTSKEREALGKGLKKLRKALDAGEPTSTALWHAWKAHRKAGGPLDYAAWAKVFRG